MLSNLIIQLAAILLSPNLEIPANKKIPNKKPTPQIRRQIYVLDANPGVDFAPIWSKQVRICESKLLFLFPYQRGDNSTGIYSQYEPIKRDLRH